MRRGVPLIAIAALLALPSPAFAATGDVVVPGWLSYATGILGLLTAVMLLVDAVLMRRVSEGSMIADNIVYMMLGVVCISAAVLVRWAGAVLGTEGVAGFVSYAADLLITAGMGLFAVYFMRVRAAMLRYLRSAQTYKESSLGEQAGG
jgi:hypothetical protein